MHGNSERTPEEAGNAAVKEGQTKILVSTIVVETAWTCPYARMGWSRRALRLWAQLQPVARTHGPRTAQSYASGNRENWTRRRGSAFALWWNRTTDSTIAEMDLKLPRTGRVLMGCQPSDRQYTARRRNLGWRAGSGGFVERPAFAGGTAQSRRVHPRPLAAALRIGGCRADER